MSRSWGAFTFLIVLLCSFTTTIPLLGVRQGCLLSPFLFILAIDWIMKTETKGKRNGIQWKISTQLDDLDFDLALMSHSHRQMQDKTTDLARISAQVGLKINKKKTKILRLDTTNVL